MFVTCAIAIAISPYLPSCLVLFAVVSIVKRAPREPPSPHVDGLAAGQQVVQGRLKEYPRGISNFLKPTAALVCNDSTLRFSSSLYCGRLLTVIKTTGFAVHSEEQPPTFNSTPPSLSTFLTMSAKAISEADGKAILNYHLTRAATIKPSPLPKPTKHNPPPRLASLHFPEDANVEDVLNQAEVTYPWLLQSGSKFVAKPDQLIKRRGKSGLLALNKTWAEAKAWIAEKAGKEQLVESTTGVLRQFLVEPFVPHPQDTEYYININSVRDVSNFPLRVFLFMNSVHSFWRVPGFGLLSHESKSRQLLGWAAVKRRNMNIPRPESSYRHFYVVGCALVCYVGFKVCSATFCRSEATGRTNGCYDGRIPWLPRVPTPVCHQPSRWLACAIPKLLAAIAISQTVFF